MTHQGHYLAILLYCIQVSVLSGYLWVLMETNNQEHLHHVHNSAGQWDVIVLPLNGTNCMKYSTSGNFLLSGVQEITRTFLANKLMEPELIAVVTKKCVMAATVIQSFIQRLVDVPAVVISLTPIASGHLPQVVRLVPSTSPILKAFVTLFQSLRWNRIGIIYDYDFHSTAVYEEFQDLFKNDNIVATYFSHFLGNISKKLLQILDDSGVKVFVLLTQEAPAILCAAYKRGMRWPYYGWLLYGYSMPDIKHIPTCDGSHRYLEGTVYPTYYTSPTTEASLEETAILLLHKASAYAAQQNKDFINALLQMQVPGISTNTLESIQKGSPAVYFVQVINGTPSTIATVYNDTVLHNRWLLEDELPRGRLPVLVNTVYPTWLGALEITVCGTLITLTLLLYIYYRNEPEVKATSWSLSLLMLLGCYLITLYLIIFTLRDKFSPNNSLGLCPLLVWLSGVGLSYALLLAVLLVKLVRVYRIFHHYGSMGKLCSNTALALYVLLLLSPIILSLIVMTSLKAYWWAQKTIVHIDHVEVWHVCAGDLSPYYAVNAIWINVLIVGIAVAAIKTRKLRHKHFRDAKKVNMFAFLVTITGISGLVLYKLFSDRGLYKPAYITIHIVHCSIIALSLGLLFTPKLTPVLFRKCYSNRNKTAHVGFAKELRTPIFNTETQ